MIAGNACAAIASVIRASNDQRDNSVIATDNCRHQARCVDSESQNLATKKFSCPPASRLIVARQNRISARIAPADSPGEFSF
jgi:hypothetical protein